jgi:predicted Na+-dependent transporter
MWSYLHLFNGRIMITLGIINGGLGLYLAGASQSLKTAYAVVAAVLWALWMLAAFAGEIRRCRADRKAVRDPALDQRPKMQDGELRA